MQNSTVEKKQKVKKNCRYISVVAPETKEKMLQYTRGPPSSTNFIFWEELSGIWGITLKCMPSNIGDNKKNPGQHVWKCTWTYDEAQKSFKLNKDCASLVDQSVISGDSKIFSKLRCV